MSRVSEYDTNSGITLEYVSESGIQHADKEIASSISVVGTCVEN